MLYSLKTKFYRRYNISFSQSGDDIQLFKLLKNKNPGKYIDVGCWHPYKSSNSYYFYLRGWKGICIDPNPEMAALFRKYRKGDTFVNAAVNDFSGTEKYYMLKHPYSSMNSMNYQFLEDQNVAHMVKDEREIKCFTLEEILDRYVTIGESLDFLDVDVEGNDLNILRSNNWEKYRPKVVMVETDLALPEDPNSEKAHFLNNVGYRLIGKSIINQDLGNLFFIDNLT